MMTIDAATSAIHIVYLPVNAAYMILWHDQRLAGPMHGSEVRGWLDERGLNHIPFNRPGRNAR